MSPAVVLGIALLALYWGWIGLFFARVRPWIMGRVGRRLGVKVAESTDFVDAGTYDAKGRRATLGHSIAVMAADLALMLAGTVGVAALVFIPAFIAADRGWLLPLEPMLTGRGGTLRIIGFTGIDAASGKGRFTLAAENAGEEPLVGCFVTVDGGTARNGYVHGTSAMFELLKGAGRTVEMDVTAMRPPPGEHAFRLELECRGERYAVADAKLAVR